MAIPSGSTPGDMFSVQTNNALDADLPGITFEDLFLQYPPITGTPPMVAAVHVAARTTSGQNNGGQNIRLLRVILEDCPIGVWFEETQQGTMIDCAGVYIANVGTCVKIGYTTRGLSPNPSGKEIYIAGCVFRNSLTTVAGSIGIEIVAAEHVRVANTRVDGFAQGIRIVPGVGWNVLRCYFDDVTVYSPFISNGIGAALTIQPQDTASRIGQLVFSGCCFEPGESGGSTQTISQPGIVVDPNGATIDTIRFVSCYACRWPGPGLLIKGGNNIEVLGGMYAGNNNSANTGMDAYGIAIIGPAVGVRIIGASCVGTYNYVTLPIRLPQSPPTQVIGILIDQGATDVIIEGCDLRKNSLYGVSIKGETATVTTNVSVRGCDISGITPYTSAVNVNGTVSNIQVTNCTGYNDAGPQLASIVPTSGATFRNYSYGYYGPVEFYTAAQGATINSISVNNNNTFLTSGSFVLQPGEYGAISWTQVGTFVPTFVMIGK
jgi:hypothetical protein